MYGTWLCERCGQRLDATMRTCPTCGAPNPGNQQVMNQYVQQVQRENRAVKSFSAGFSIVTLILGILLLLVHMVLLVSGPPIYLVWEAFAGAVSAGMMAVFSIIGLAKNEGVGKAVMICGGVSLWMLFMFVFIAL